MIRLVVKGREESTKEELQNRALMPLIIIEEKSHFLEGFYSCNVTIFESPANMAKVHQWWADDETRQTGQGFRDGALFLYSVGEDRTP